MDHVGDLEYKFYYVDRNIPLVMQEWDRPVEQVLKGKAGDWNAFYMSAYRQIHTHKNVFNCIFVIAGAKTY